MIRSLYARTNVDDNIRINPAKTTNSTSADFNFSIIANSNDSRSENNFRSTQKFGMPAFCARINAGTFGLSVNTIEISASSFLSLIASIIDYRSVPRPEHNTAIFN